MAPSVRRLEEAGLNAWPALRVAHVDGWVLRFADGFTKRANSANPLYGEGGDLDARIDRVEAIYAGVGQRAIFRLTDLAPPSLDGLLDGRGYRRIDETIVQTLDISGTVVGAAPGFAPAEAASAWVEPASVLQGEPAESRPTLRAMLERMVPRACFGLVRRDGGPVACGLAVVEDDLVGLFEIAVDPTCRRAGLGLSITRSLLAWGRGQGAATAYLQVTAGNSPARALYDGIGFRESHRYWYRVAPG